EGPPSPADAGREPDPERTWAPSESIGRYTVLQKLGSGGMGEVILAYDNRLARRVAIKLLLTAARSPDARARMLREAQAMAQLAHPNVVTVYDVGVHEDDV